MRLIPVNDLEDGMVLGKSIYTFNNKLMLGAGFRLTAAFRAKLVERGMTHIYIIEEGTEDVVPEDIISDEIRFQARSRIADTAEKIQNHFNIKDISRQKVFDLIQNGYLQKVNLTQDMKNVVVEILNDISAAGAGFLNTAMFKSKDSYSTDHAINVTILSILIGKKYGFTKSELVDLALGSFLHDFGKIVIEKMKPASAELSEELLSEHPTFGYLIVHNSRNASPIVSQIVNQHHENQDGSGYPIGLIGENLPPTSSVKRNTKNTIYRLAEICHVANAFDNIAMNPHDDTPVSPGDAIKQLVLGAGTKYNKHIVSTLTKVVPSYPVGAFVKIRYLLDSSLIGYRGVVARNNEQHLNKPQIILLFDRANKRIPPRLIDTSKLKNVELELIL